MLSRERRVEGPLLVVEYDLDVRLALPSCIRQ